MNNNIYHPQPDLMMHDNHIDNHWQNGANGSSEEVRPVHKRIRMLSDSEPDSSPVKFDNLNLPLAEDIEKKVSFLKDAYPDIDEMVLQDTLKYVVGDDPR